MRANADAVCNLLRFLYLYRRSPPPISICRSVAPSCPWFSTVVQLCLDEQDPPRDVAGTFRRWGCSDDEISKIFTRHPCISKSDLNLLQSKLKRLGEIGLVGSDLVKIITCRPRFLACRLGPDLNQRLQFLDSLFGSRQNLLRVIVRNPSILNYDVEKHMKPCLALYESVGVTQKDLSALLLSRPTLIMRSSLNDEKLHYIHRTGLSKESKLYKHIVSIIAVSRIETIYVKVANLEKFGLSVEEVMRLCGCCPVILTLSVDKVQRNMTHVVGTMKLPAKIVLDYPNLLYASLDKVLKPRFLLAEKIKAMSLLPQIKGPMMMRAFRMKESTFIRVFITCHDKKVATFLMDYYSQVKGFKRLAEDSKAVVQTGFPF